MTDRRRADLAAKIEARALWRHDGRDDSPYARLSSGLISNMFCNVGRIAEEDPLLFWQCGQKLGFESIDRLRPLPSTPRLRVIGAEYGGIALSVSIAAAIATAGSAFASKQKDGSLSFERAQLEPGEAFLMIEDTITTGGTLEKLERAALAASPGCTFAPFVVAICNRSGQEEWAGRPILSLYTPDMSECRTWEEGNNPFTHGPELVPPIERPKLEWRALTRPRD